VTTPTIPRLATELRPGRNRHRDEYWDVFTASWRRHLPTVPVPRSGD
jgi:hypothetical protein